jgi:limonene-1,2-epoxide hydrolase
VGPSVRQVARNATTIRGRFSIPDAIIVRSVRAALWRGGPRSERDYVRWKCDSTDKPPAPVSKVPFVAERCERVSPPTDYCPEMPGELVTRFIDEIVANDLDTASSLISDDIEYDNVPMGKVNGKDAFRSFLGPFLDSASEIEWVIHHQVASGDLNSGVVMNERIDRFKMVGGWMEPPVAGLFVIQNGLITLWRDYFDLATFQSQLASASN